MKILHLGIHDKKNKNSGDTLLFIETRKLFDKYFYTKINWTLMNLWDEIKLDLVSELNNNYGAILIGGGGLFLKDQKGADSSKSGWQLNCSVEILKKIKIPIIIFGVGYNRFRNQEDFDKVFYESANVLAKKSIFIGLRNNGSIEAFKNYIDKEDFYKLHKQTCPTTILKSNKSNKSKNIPKLSFNLAFDRPNYRFEGRKEEILNSISRALYKIVDYGVELDICLHKDIDIEITNYLPTNLKYRLINLTDLDSVQIVDYYSKIDLAVGLRGHAQLIPFGLNKKILSIISHDKLGFFLKDIGHEDLGVDVRDDNFEQKLFSLMVKIINDDTIHDKLYLARKELVHETKSNFDLINKLLISDNE